MKRKYTHELEKQNEELMERLAEKEKEVESTHASNLLVRDFILMYFADQYHKNAKKDLSGKYIVPFVQYIENIGCRKVVDEYWGKTPLPATNLRHYHMPLSSDNYEAFSEFLESVLLEYLNLVRKNPE
jgi:hypothetical protein